MDNHTNQVIFLNKMSCSYVIGDNADQSDDSIYVTNSQDGCSQYLCYTFCKSKLHQSQINYRSTYYSQFFTASCGLVLNFDKSLATFDGWLMGFFKFSNSCKAIVSWHQGHTIPIIIYLIFHLYLCQVTDLVVSNVYTCQGWKQRWQMFHQSVYTIIINFIVAKIPIMQFIRWRLNLRQPVKKLTKVIEVISHLLVHKLLKHEHKQMKPAKI